MESGDIVRLKQPFKPKPEDSQNYQFGIVAGLVRTGDEEIEQSVQPSEILVYLYNPETDTVYIDEFGTQAVFLFQLNEIDQ